MVRLIIEGQEFYGFTIDNLSLIYNAITSSFGFSSLSDYAPAPLTYPKVEIYHDDELILSGNVLNQTHQASASPNLVSISGYSRAGILDDCTIPLSEMPMQLDNMSLKEICTKLFKTFNISFTYENSVANLMNKKFVKANFDYDKTIKGFIVGLATERGIYVNHLNDGSVHFTDSSVKNLTVVEHFEDFGVTNMTLDIDGQSMHSDISVLAQADEKDIFEGETTIKNPYVTSVTRPIIHLMKNGDSLDVKEYARLKLSEELRAIKLKISTTKFVKPGQLISVKSDRLNLNHDTKFFVEQCDIKDEVKGLTYDLTCVLKDVYSKTEVKNEFRES